MKRHCWANGYRVVLAGLLLAWGLHAQAETATQQERAKLVAEIEQTLADPQQRAQAMRAGEERSLLCASCHGADGNSRKGDMPNLAGQNPAYLVEQIMLFAEGVRENFVMQALTREFTFADKVHLAVYFSSQQVKPVSFDAQLASRGEAIYTRSCFRCHGASGKGEAGYARLAGQQIDYVEMTLKRYRANANQTTPPHQKRRSDPNMEQVTAQLSDDDIRHVAHYIASMR